MRFTFSIKTGDRESGEANRSMFDLVFTTDDDTYDGEGCPIGHGATEAEAIADLKEKIVDRLRSHWAWRAGRQGRHHGHPCEAPFLPGTSAAAAWIAGWQDADEYGRVADRLTEAEFDHNYCPAEA